MAADGPPRRRCPRASRCGSRPRTRVRDGGRTLLGGGFGRLLYLSERAAGLLSSGGLLVVADPTTALLARSLLDAGFADPDWAAAGPAGGSVRGSVGEGEVTVVVPVRDRPAQLERLLALLAAGHPGLAVLVVDDGSRDPAAVAGVAARHGARLLTHPVNRGPAAARNTGLRAAGTAYVVFCDSDVSPQEGWLGLLLRHFEDPAVGLVAPRVLGHAAAPGDGWLTRYEQARSSLDLGPRAAAVRPTTPVSYLPSACLVGRSAALGGGFDETLRVAEDVDLVWRTAAAGWSVRYEPAAHVRHDHRTALVGWLRRKAYYGTGAAPLARRHGAAVAPLVLTPFGAVVAVAALAQRRWSVPAVAGAGVLTSVALARRLGRSSAPLRTAAGLSAQGASAALAQTGQSLVRHHWPLAVLAATRSRRARRALVVAAVVDGVLDRRRVRPALDPIRYLAARRLDDLAYGAGLWWGAARAGSARALLPDVRRSRRG